MTYVKHSRDVPHKRSTYSSYPGAVAQLSPAPPPATSTTRPWSDTVAIALRGAVAPLASACQLTRKRHESPHAHQNRRQVTDPAYRGGRSTASPPSSARYPGPG